MNSAFFKQNRVLAWLLAIIVVAAAAYGIYYSQARKSGDAQKVATLPQAEKSDRPAGADDAGGEQAASAPKVEPVPGDAGQGTAAGAAAPTFDVLRVEKDGSTVIAGAGPANSLIDILADGKVVASGKSNAAGDFAIVFDKPLASGDYELSIRATGEDGKAISSAETGVVHVPEKGAGEDVIAMVAKEGEASRVLQAPDAKGTESASAETGTKEAPASETGTAGEAAGSSEQVASANPAPEAGGDTGQAAKNETAADDAAGAQAPASETAQEKNAGPVGAPVLVKAVDVDGGKIFVAGSGEPGRSVNIYLDDKLLGTTEIGPEGSFLLESAGDMTAGSHEIRADMLAEGSAEVTNRAVVPLVHEPPAAVASAKPAEQQAEQGEQKVAAAQTGETAPEKPASGDSAQTGGDANAPASGETADAGSGNSATMVSKEPAAGTDQQMASGEEKPAASAESGQKTTETPGETAGQGAAETAMAKPATGTESAAETPAVASGETSAEKPAGEKPAAADQPATAGERMAAKPESGNATQAESGGQMAAAESSGEAKTAEPIRTGANVIIRRGDNLWTISRRMLGAGFRYTVIYEANRGQIRNPHWIYPGQVFDVPGAENTMPRG